MVIVDIERNKEKQITRFSVSGHANAGEYGKDIVCAAISVLSQTMILGIYDIIGIEVPYKIDDGYLTCEIPKNITNRNREDLDILLETMVVGMKNIKENYNKYIIIHDREV